MDFQVVKDFWSLGNGRLAGTQCKTLQEKLVKGELRLPLVRYVYSHVLQTSEDLKRASDEN